MGDPSFNSDERVLIRTPGIHVKSIPFEGTLTNRRIILTDRAKNILPSKDIPLATIQRVGVGENALQDPILNISVIPHPGETRQMVLAFSRQEGGNRVRERDEWARLIQDYLSRSAAPPAQPRYEAVSTPVQPVRAPAPAAGAPPAHSGETVFCTRCGNRVPVESVFCNRCGTPIVAPAGVRQPAAPQRQAAPVASEPVYTPPAPAARAPEPAYQPAYPAPAPAPVRYEEPAPARQPAPPRPAPQPAPQKAAKKGLFARLFPAKGSKPAATRQPAPEMAPRKSRMPGKKTLMIGIAIIIVIAIVAAGVIFVLPTLSSALPSGSVLPTGGSSGGSSGTTSSGTIKDADMASITVKETTAIPLPATGVWVMISYLGGYKGTYGMSSAIQNVTDSGDKIFEVENANGTILATIAKQDSSTKHDLTVGIYKDGKLLKSDKTSASYGKVTVSADVGTITATPSPTTTGSGNVTAKTTGNSTTTIKPAGNTTTKAANVLS